MGFRGLGSHSREIRVARDVQVQTIQRDRTTTGIHKNHAWSSGCRAVFAWAVHVAEVTGSNPTLALSENQ